MTTHLDRVLLKLKEFEGCVPWMHRDTVGRVTVGVGLVLPAVSSAQALPFTIAGRPASADEIAADFKRVLKLQAARSPEFYRDLESPELPDEICTGSLRDRLMSLESDLQGKMKCYDGLPDNVRTALLDMAYNLGPTVLFQGYSVMIQAVETGAWSQAAVQSIRPGESSARNTWTRAMFLAGAARDAMNAGAGGSNWWEPVKRLFCR